MQILTDLSDNLVAGNSLDGTAKTVSAQGASVDMLNYEVMTGAAVQFGAPVAAVTGMTVQVEEWNGTTASGSTWTAIPNMVGSSVTTGPTTQVLIGLRTHRYVRVNALTVATNTNSNVPITGMLLAMPKSSQSPTGYSRSPSS